ncbi:MAG: rhodanese-like domain-containing protein [Pseudomonadales bacterium]|jgi:rhodanese-related sulfurtransferase|nr:rhodanese-like domain-containing protein [Pseudomonadales bacterium]MDP5059505.1 rhodanese-like domain-containing protein [Pseudomonadales bacterium]
MPITTGVKQLVDAAEREIESLSLAEAKAMLGGEEAVFVDIRDIRELQREGKIKGAIHAPRGMLEFWVDPASPYHRDVFAQEKTYVLYCASAWRSALATQALQNMGMDNVCHIAGGFTAWKAAELPMEPVPVKAD